MEHNVYQFQFLSHDYHILALQQIVNTNKQVKDDICRSRFALFINNIKRDIKRRRHHYREPSRIPIKALKALKHCGFVDKEKQNNDGYTRSMEINKATFMHHAKMPAGHLVIFILPRSRKRQCLILIEV